MSKGLIKIARSRPGYSIAPFLFALLLAHSSLYASQDSAYVNLQGKRITIASVFKALQQQTGYIVFYDNSLLNDQEKVDVNFLHSSVPDIISFVINGKDLTYVVKERFILLKKKQQAAPKAGGNGAAGAGNGTVNGVATAPQDFPVSGVVKNAEGEPLSGVSVTLKGTRIGTSTNVRGEFTLTLPTETGVLIFSYVGYEKQELKVGRESKVTVKLVMASNSLNQIVVTALGLRQEKKSLTYATQSVSTEQLTEARELNVMNSLEGKVAGLSISQNGGGVGGASRVVLRGNRSIFGDSQPLYVVDGVPTIGYPEDLDPDNFASINVLKGANAAALYGSDAQNGAIIITTKKGRADRNMISVNNTFMLQQADMGLPFQNLYGQGDLGAYQSGSAYAWGPQMTGQTVASWTLDPSRAGETYAMSPQPHNVMDLFHNGYTISSNVQMSTGTEKSQTFFSMTSTEGSGILPLNTLLRESFLLRTTNKLTDKLTLDAKMNYTLQNTNNPTRESADNYNPVQQIYTMPRNIRTKDAKRYEYLNANGLLQQDYWAPGVVSTAENPYWVLNRNLSYDKLNRFTGMVSLTYDLAKDLNLMVRGSYDRLNDNGQQMDYDGTLVRAPYGRYTVTKSFTYNLNSDFLLSYTRKLSDDWKFDVHAGGNLKYVNNDTMSANTGVALLVPNFFSLSNSNLPVTSYSPGAPLDIQSLYAFGNINWREAVYLSVTGRNDWSSTLPANSRSYFYPSVGASVLLNSLIPDFPKVFSIAKLRASYAKVGSSAPPFMLQRFATFSSGGTNGFLQLNGILPNTELKPEQTTSTEAGFNVGFFKGRLGLDFTYYNTNTGNQLFTISLPVGSGASSLYTNGGDVRNRGVEIELNTVPVEVGHFRWELDFNFSHVRNTVVRVSDQRPKVIVANQSYISQYVIQQGKNFGDMYTFGLVRDSLGRVIVAANGLPEITSSQSVDVGTYTPDWMGGISSTISYKNLSFSFVIDHRQGGVVEDYTDANLVYFGLSKATVNGRNGGLVFGQNFFSNYKTVTTTGKENTTPVTAESFWKTMGNPSIPVGELFARSGTNTRLREAAISYSLPRTFSSRMHVANIKVSLVGRNLFFISRSTPGLDPDILTGTGTASEGFSSFAPPTTRSFGANLKVDLK
ncbi:MAG TPA: SusC/RagA family TonB-linked outer membrane protein [Puia sp.]|nr:SusC/RagA family TonB-linked outer membrane protein [Puia sp.]